MNLKDEIDHLGQMLLKMVDLVSENINEAVELYTKKRTKVDFNDDLVDHYELLIEELCLNILLKERPYAKDLKIVTGILKLVADVERIGDHAEDIVNFASMLNEIPKNHSKVIDNLTNYVVNMLKDAILAYVNSDLNLAQKVIDSDDHVDETYAKIVEELAHPKDNINNSYVPFAIYTTLVVKYLERIADHCVNIAEWVIYIVSGYHKNIKIY